MATLPIPASTINPVLAEIDQAHAQLSPEAQKALAIARQATDVAPAPGTPAPPPVAPVMPPARAAAPIAPSGDTDEAAATVPFRPMAAPGRAVPTLGNMPTPEQQSHLAERNRLVSSPSGIAGIKNPWARIPLQIAEAVGGGFFPGIDTLIPGTQLHHNALVRQAQGAVNQDTEQNLREAQARHASAEADTLENPEAKPVTKEWQEITGGAIDPAHPEVGPQPAFYNKNNPKEGIVFGNAPSGKAEKQDIHSMYAAAVADAQKRGVAPMDDPKVQDTLRAIVAEQKQPAEKPEKPDVHTILAEKINDALSRKVDPNEDPQVQQVTKAIRAMAASPGDTELIDKDVAGKPHNVLVKKSTGATIADLGLKGRTPENPPQTMVLDPATNKMVLLRPGSMAPTGAITTTTMSAQNAPTTQQRNVAAQAQLVHEQTPMMLAEIDKNKDKIGALSGRWNEFMQGKVGMDDPEFAALRSDLLMYSSAVALMHARGRLPENLREEFDREINNPKQSVDNLKATISHIDQWTAKNMEMGGRNQAPMAGAASNAGGSSADKVNKLVDKYK